MNICNSTIALPSEAVLHDQSALYIIWFHQQLVAACRAGDVKTVQRLLSLGVNVNPTDEVHICAYVSNAYVFDIHRACVCSQVMMQWSNEVL